METGSHQDWIAGEWRPAEQELEFVLRGTEPRDEPPGVWPRSGAADVELALSAIARAQADWARQPLAARCELVERALAELEPPAAPARGARDPVATALGLRRRELAPHRAQALAGARELLARARARPQALACDGAVLVRARAAELFDGLLRRLVEPLCAGRGLLLVSDPGLPELAEELARALESAGPPPGLISLLHDDGLTVLRAAVAHAGIAEARLSGWRRELRDLEGFAQRRARAERPAIERAPFGAGVVAGIASGSPLEFSLVRNRPAVVLAGDDVEARAAELAEAAFGRATALGGQLASQVGRIYCHEAQLSRFTEVLLQEVLRIESHAAPVRVIDPELAQVAARRRRLGLDEGATLIHGPTESAAGSRHPLAEGTLCASVFTNVEPRMRLARAARPVPVLALLRAASDESARAMAGCEPDADDPPPADR